LFFFIGLGIDLNSFKRKSNHSIRLGFLSTLVPFIFGSIIATVLGYDIYTVLVIGICASVGAQSICVMLFEEVGMLKKRLGEDVIGAGVVADVIQLSLVSVLFGLIPSVGANGFTSLMWNWVYFFTAIILIKVLLLPIFFRVIHEEQKTHITFFSAAVILALVMGYLSEVLSLGSILGAIFTGIVIRQFFDRKIVNRISQDMKLIGFGFFVPLVFVWTGFQTNIDALGGNVITGLVLAFFAVTGTLIGTFWAFRRTRHSKRDKWLAGIGLGTKGDVEIILATVMLEAQVITSGAFSAIIVMSVATMIAAPLMFYYIAEKTT